MLRAVDGQERPATGSFAPVTLESLLDEMVKPRPPRPVPDPAYVTGQASSYDRASIAPDKPGWFANHDFEMYIRTETRQGRTEYVMMDVDGPGAIVRWWEGGHDVQGTIRVYLDGAKTAAIEENIETFLGGTGQVQPPLAAVRCLGLNFYLPIPYAKHCKVTFDRSGQPLVQHRIPHLSRRHVGEDLHEFQAWKRRPRQSTAFSTRCRFPTTMPLPSVASPVPDAHSRSRSAIETTLDGPAAVRMLTVRINTREPRDLPQALRSTVLSITFDGEETVWCPVGDFSAAAWASTPTGTGIAMSNRSGLLHLRLGHALRQVLPHRN